jgi:hypothetical protein
MPRHGRVRRSQRSGADERKEGITKVPVSVARLGKVASLREMPFTGAQYDVASQQGATRAKARKRENAELREETVLKL